MKNYILILLCFLLWNCQEDELPLYHGKSCVYFSAMSNIDYSVFVNQMSFSFGMTSVMDTVLYLPVTGTGDTTGYDRYFSFVVDSTTAQEGLHFDPLPEKGILPAGSAVGYIPITLHRVLDDDSLYQIHFRLVSDNEFEVNIPEAYDDSNDTTDLTRLTLTFSSSIAQPNGWIVQMLGYFSLAKYNLCYELTGETWETIPNASLAMAYGNIFNNYISSRILEGKEKALKDPQNKQEGGYMSMRGRTMGSVMNVPEEWYK